MGGNVIDRVRKRPALIFKAVFRFPLRVYVIGEYYRPFLAVSVNNPVAGFIRPCLYLPDKGSLERVIGLQKFIIQNRLFLIPPYFLFPKFNR
jgi:hypothetical protein